MLNASLLASKFHGCVHVVSTIRWRESEFTLVSTFFFPILNEKGSILFQVTEMLVNVLNICSDDELVSDTDDALEEGTFLCLSNENFSINYRKYYTVFWFLFCFLLKLNQLNSLKIIIQFDTSASIKFLC